MNPEMNTESSGPHASSNNGHLPTNPEAKPNSKRKSIRRFEWISWFMFFNNKDPPARVLADSWLRMSHAIALASKHAGKPLVENILKFAHGLGTIAELEFVADGEEAMKSLLANLETVRNFMQRKTHTRRLEQRVLNEWFRRCKDKR